MNIYKRSNDSWCIGRNPITIKLFLSQSIKSNFMRHFYLLFFGIFCSFSSIFAQSNAAINVENDIILKNGYYLKSGAKHSYGFAYRNIKNELKVNPDAITTFRKAEKNLLYAYIPLTVGLAAIFYSNHVQSNTTRNALFWGGCGVGIVGGVYFLRQSKNHFYESVRIRNRDLR
jgi:hypothetical protein